MEEVEVYWREPETKLKTALEEVTIAKDGIIQSLEERLASQQSEVEHWWESRLSGSLVASEEENAVLSEMEALPGELAKSLLLDV